MNEFFTGRVEQEIEDEIKSERAYAILDRQWEQSLDRHWDA